MTSLKIEKAEACHIPDLARIHVEGWKAAYKGIIDQSYLDSLSVDDRENDWRGWMQAGETTTFLATKDDISAGFVTVGKLKTPPPGTSKIRPVYSSEIYAIYLLPEYWGQGIGHALLQHGMSHLKSDGHKSTCLWVLDGNKRAMEFYAKHGGERIGKIKVTIGPNTVRELCYGWRDINKIIG